jgi:hypothetical protein
MCKELGDSVLGILVGYYDLPLRQRPIEMVVVKTYSE